MNLREQNWAEAMRAARRGDSAAYKRLLSEIAGVLRGLTSGASAGRSSELVRHASERARQREAPGRTLGPPLISEDVNRDVVERLDDRSSQLLGDPLRLGHAAFQRLYASVTHGIVVASVDHDEAVAPAIE